MSSAVVQVDVVRSPIRVNILGGSRSLPEYQILVLDARGSYDPDFPTARRDHVYYVRAIQEPAMGVNAASLRCELDADGRCVEVRPCYGDYRTAPDDDCLAETEERAWSSPIFIGYEGPQG